MVEPPLWKICSSNWIISPRIGVKIKHIWNHHPVLFGENLSLTIWIPYLKNSRLGENPSFLIVFGLQGFPVRCGKMTGSHLNSRQSKWTPPMPPPPQEIRLYITALFLGGGWPWGGVHLDCRDKSFQTETDVSNCPTKMGSEPIIKMELLINPTNGRK